MRLIRRPEVEAKTGRNRASIYEGMSDGMFPRSVPIGNKAVAWVEAEIDKWIAERVAARDGGKLPPKVEPGTRKDGVKIRPGKRRAAGEGPPKARISRRRDEAADTSTA